MKYVYKLIIIILIAFLLLPVANATRGVGIKYSVASQIIKEGKTACINYGVYNPWDEDVNISLKAGGDLKNFPIRSDSIFVPANTPSTESKNLEICFDIPVLSNKECILSIFACAVTCENAETVFEGDIIADGGVAGTVGASGSQVSVTASAPLKLTVKCEEKDRNIIPFVSTLAGIMILAITIILIFWYRKRAHDPERKMKEYDKLKERMQELQGEMGQQQDSYKPKNEF